MKVFLVAALFSFSAPVSPRAFGAAAASKCTCTCVVKDTDGTYSTKTATGPDRESAGEALKKKLGKLKCELSPECKGGSCKADS
jgi:hypothetical protein